MNELRVLAVCTLLLGAGACATQPVRVVEARPIAASKLLPGYAAVSAPVPGGAKFVVVRDSGFLGGGATVSVLVDGTAIGRLQPGDRIEFFLPSGEHILGTEFNRPFDKPVSEVGVSVFGDKTYYFRVSILQGGTVHLSQTTQVQ